MRRVLILSAGADTGGVGFQLALAVRGVPGWSATQVVRSANYIAYPHDVLWPIGEPVPEAVAEAARTADVLHVMESWDACRFIDGWQDRPLVLHHHGSIFRAQHAMLARSAEELRAEVVVATPDLQLIDPGAEWLPNPVDIAAMQRLRFPSGPGSARFTFAHTPTNRAFKSTVAVQAAAAAAGVALDVVEGATWAESLARKARADAVFDQLALGYGLSGLEAMAMGLPVVAGATDPDGLMRSVGVPGGSHMVEALANRWGYLPFLAATPETLADRLAEVRDDPDLAQDTARRGMYHARRFHDAPRVAAQLVQVYERAIGAKR